jgi:hypothetical protein
VPLWRGAVVPRLPGVLGDVGEFAGVLVDQEVERSVAGLGVLLQEPDRERSKRHQPGACCQEHEQESVDEACGLGRG